MMKRRVLTRKERKPMKMNLLSWSSKERTSYLSEVLIIYFPTIFRVSLTKNLIFIFGVYRINLQSLEERYVSSR